jgi:hypothetical protein
MKKYNTSIYIRPQFIIPVFCFKNANELINIFKSWLAVETSKLFPELCKIKESTLKSKYANEDAIF